jgi:hypothetical protein
MRWILILGYQQWKSWTCLFDLLTTLCWLVINIFPCESEPRRVSCLLIDSFIIIQLFWQRSLVASALGVTSFCVTLFYRIVGNLTPTLVQNFIFNSIDLLMRISFRVILITNAPYGSIRLNADFMWINECTKKDSFPLSCIDMIYETYLCNVKCMIHFDLRYAHNHYDYLILVYTIILSLRQAFQGLTTNGSFCLTEMLKLRENQYSQVSRMFWGSKRNWVSWCPCGQWYS